ncbi:MAG: hypothetical protein M0P69_19145 [Bacteroidales bacterium]|nr:hypothetical protein [Bacteroidales bacterium]
MLVPAILHEEQLKKNYAKAICDDHYKFYMATSYRNFTPDVKNSDWNTIQRVSIDKDGNVIGFMSAEINRDSKVIDRFGLLNFTKAINLIFAQDLIKFIRELRDRYDASKFEFMAFVGGEAEQMYRKFIGKHGGNIVGTMKRTSKLIDGKYYDATMFEIMREDMNF